MTHKKDHEKDNNLYINIRTSEDGTPILDLSFHFGVLLREIEMTYDRDLCVFVIPLYTFIETMREAGVLDQSKYIPPTFFIHSIRFGFNEMSRVITVYYKNIVMVELEWKLSSIYILLTKLPYCAYHKIPPIVNGSMVFFPQTSDPKRVNRIVWKSSNIYSIGDIRTFEISTNKKKGWMKKDTIENVSFTRVVDLYFSQSQPCVDQETGEWLMNRYIPIIEVGERSTNNHKLIFVDPDIKYKLTL